MSNKLYSYTTISNLINSMVNTPGWLEVKQGLTLKQEIEERTSQQDNASSTADIIVLSTLVVEDNEDLKLDDKVREYLHETSLFQKFERFNNKTKKHEWSLVKIDDLIPGYQDIRNEFLRLQSNNLPVNQFLNDNILENKEFLEVIDTRIFKAKQECIEALYGQKTFKDYSLRPAQQKVYDKFMISYNEEYRYFNLDACVRVGKSILSLSIAKTLNMFPCYIGKNLTSQSSVQKDNNDFGIVENMLTQSIHGIETDSIQRIIDNINTNNRDNLQIIFFVDEVDDASHTRRSRDTISEVTKQIKSMGLFGAFVTMSGTRSYRGLKVLNDLNPDKIKEIDIAYYEMQQVQPECTVKRNFKNITIYSSETELLSISDALKSGTGRKSLAKTLSMLLGENTFNIDVNNEYPHYFVKFATVGKSNATALVNILNRMHGNIDGKKFKFFNINGDTTSSREAERFCKDIIDVNDCTCVFITQGMATTSFSVKEIGTSIVVSDNELTSDDIQALHRSCTWAEGKDNANLIYVTTSETMELKFDDIFENEVKTLEKSEMVQKYKEILERNCITHYIYSGDKTVPIEVNLQNIDLVIDKKQKQMTTVSSIIQMMIDEEIPEFDYCNHNVRKSGTAKGSDVDVFGTGSKESKPREKSDEMSNAEKQRILRELISIMVIIPAVYRIKNIPLYNDIDWDRVGISKELFFMMIQEFPMLKSRIESIYNLCSEKKYLNDMYFDTVSNI